MATPSKYAARRLAGISLTTIWVEFGQLAAKYKSVPLSQGFPSFAPHPMVLNHMKEAAGDPSPLAQQYAPQRGHPLLLEQLQAKYRSMLGREQIAPEELVVVNGTTQAINICMAAFINPEEEVIMFEPFFDLYENDVALSHGQSKFVPLHPDPKTPTANAWRLDFDELERAITKGKTKAIMLNSPQNVPGKVWGREELEKLAAVAKKHDLLVFSDEVYDKFVWDGQEHISIASLPGMWERTVTMCSAGKTFTVTGLKIGWMCAPKELIISCMQVQAHQCFSVATPCQVGVARAMADAEAHPDFYREMLEGYDRRRGMLLNDVIKAGGLLPIVPQGSYFAMADISMVPKELYMEEGAQLLMPGAPTDVAPDWKFCRWLTKEVGVTCLPCSAFCSKERAPMYQNYVRFAFCKTEADIVEAGKRMKEKLAPLLKRE